MKYFLIKKINSAIKLVVPVILIISAYCAFLIYNSVVSAQTTASGDAIAIRVIPNPEHYSPLRWYKNQGWSGSPQSITVDGYEAVRDGRTVYVNAANIVGDTLYTNIYLISYNQDAEKETMDIFGRVLSKWKFNTNVEGAGNCSEPIDSSKALNDCAGTVGCWHFDGDYKDSSGKDNNGTSIGSVPFVAGAFNEAASFEGASYINVLDSASLKNTPQLSISAWIKSYDAKQLLRKEGLYNIWTGTDYAMFETKAGNACTSTWKNVSAAGVDYSMWAFVAGVYDGSTMKIYINGELKESKPATGLIGNCSSPLWIGYSPGSYFRGLIDELKIYNRALSADEVMGTYKSVTNCLTDENCSGAGYCSSPKAGITRDTIRLSRMVDFRLALSDYYNKNRHYPVLAAGTYLPNISISVWPSWQESLGKELGISVPVDPVNKLGSCSGYDKKTCWNKDLKKFADSDLIDPGLNLPVGSDVFIYKSESNGASYNICANMDSGLVSIEDGNCAENIIENIPPVIISSNFPFIRPGMVFKAYFAASNPDNDILNWSVDTSLTAWPGWSAPPVIRKVAVKNQIELYAAKAGASGSYDIKITVNDGRGGTDTKSYKIMVNVCVDEDGDGFAREGGDCGIIDCDDNNKNKFPGNLETCDNNDNNCNAQIDEGCDDDGDKYCDNSMLIYNNTNMCTKTIFTGNGMIGNDCDDDNTNINPGKIEVCGNSIDDDCDGDVDEGCNKDGDIYCSCIMDFVYGSDLSAICSGTNTTDRDSWLATCDCDDDNLNINPGAAENCDNDLDDDCNGMADCNDSICAPLAICDSCGIDGCTSGEDCYTCSLDCGLCPGTCPDGYCNPLCETVVNCPEDCDTSSCSAGGLVWQIGDIEASQMDDPADEFGLDYDFVNPFVIGVNSNIDFVQGQNFDLSKAVNNYVDFNMPYDAQVELLLSWSPGESDNERKEIFLNGVSIGQTAIRTGVTVAGWHGGDKRFIDTIGPFNISEGLNTLRFKHLYGNGTYWDYIQLKVVSCPSTACIAPPVGLTGWWTGNGNANDNFDGNNGTISGTTYVAGKVDQAFNFSGGGYVNIPETGSNLDGFTELTINAWIKPSSLGDFAIVTKYNSTMAEGISYYFMNRNGKLAFSIFDDISPFSTDKNIGILSSGLIPVGVWSHVAGVWRGGVILELYLNGELFPGTIVNTGGFAGAMANNNNAVRIGSIISTNPPGSMFYFNGQIDEVQIYNKALSAAEIKSISDAGSLGTCYNICKFPFTLPCVLP